MAIDYANIVKLSKTVVVEEEKSGYTAYGVYSEAKKAFDALGMTNEFVTKTGRQLESQNFYNYAKSGRINGVKSSTQRFSEDEVIYFIAKLVKMTGVDFGTNE